MAQHRSEHYKARFLPSAKRLPLQPLLDTLANDHYATTRLIQLGHVSLARYAATGVPLRTADRFAVDIAHRHPVEIWGDAWWDDVLPTQEVTE